MSMTNIFPWRKENYNYSDGVIGLHEEIDHYYQYILPTPCEHVVRNELVKRIEAMVHNLWPMAVVEIFGSFRTGLLLPNSDIDIVIIGLWEKLPLRTLESELIARRFAESRTMHVLDMAQVPIIKFVDCETKIKVDISFNMQSGVHSAELIKLFKREYPVLSKLVMVVKQFLQQRGLNEVFSGGISSYSLTIMCVSFLQLHPRKVVASKANLGVLLLEFFELYGSRFSYTNIQISVENGGSYRRAPLTSISQIFLPDPLNLENNIGRATNRIMAIRQAFRWAFQVLTLSINSTQRNNNSILGQIIHFNKEVVDQRAWLHKTFGHLIVVKPNEDESTSSQPVEPNS